MAVDDQARGAAYLAAGACGMVPDDVTAAWADGAADVLEWLEKTTGAGFSRINTAEHPDLPGAEAIGVHQQGDAAFRLDPSAGGGDALFRGWRPPGTPAASTCGGGRPQNGCLLPLYPGGSNTCGGLLTPWTTRQAAKRTG